MPPIRRPITGWTGGRRLLLQRLRRQLNWLMHCRLNLCAGERHRCAAEKMSACGQRPAGLLVRRRSRRSTSRAPVESLQARRRRPTTICVELADRAASRGRCRRPSGRRTRPSAASRNLLRMSVGGLLEPRRLARVAGLAELREDEARDLVSRPPGASDSGHASASAADTAW